jgi:hypothetical protein
MNSFVPAGRHRQAPYRGSGAHETADATDRRLVLATRAGLGLAHLTTAGLLVYFMAQVSAPWPVEAVAAIAACQNLAISLWGVYRIGQDLHRR